MRVELHPAALQELIDSARYYENRLPGLGTDFKSEVSRSLDLLSENPDIGGVIEAPYRRLLLDRFLLPSFTEPEGLHCEFWQSPINAEGRDTGEAVNKKRFAEFMQASAE
jgi:plasmid stabilization system protein ParE